MNASPLRSGPPLHHSSPVWPLGSLRKAWLLSCLTRGANGGITMKEATSRVGQAQDGGGPRLVCHGSGGGAAADGPALGRPASMRAGQCGGCRRRDGGTAHDGLIVSMPRTVAVRALCRRPTSSTASPTWTRPRAIRPVTITPRRLRRKTSSMGKRNRRCSSAISATMTRSMVRESATMLA